MDGERGMGARERGRVVSSCPIGWGHGSGVEYLPCMSKFLSLITALGAAGVCVSVCVCLAWRLGITVNNAALVSLSIFTSKFGCSLR